MKRVAVIDIGSNSIKALVAESDGSPHGLNRVFEKGKEVRISQGITGEPPLLKPDRIEAGVEAVAQLWTDCKLHGPLSASCIVATSAVRSAANGHLLTEAVESVTGQNPVTLSGAAEADGIAHGVRTDPAVRESLHAFTVFDLGGGSLEIIRFENDNVVYRTSFPLGSVRLTEQFIPDPKNPVSRDVAARLAGFVEHTIMDSGIEITPPLVGCSGGLTTLRVVRSEQNKIPFHESSPVFFKSDMDVLAEKVLKANFAERIELLGLPAGRADIFPAAMLTFQVLLKLAGTDEILHSLHNLRYGIAWQLLHPHG